MSNEYQPGMLVQSLRRLYEAGRVKETKLAELRKAGKIRQADCDYIAAGRREVK